MELNTIGTCFTEQNVFCECVKMVKKTLGLITSDYYKLLELLGLLNA